MLLLRKSAIQHSFAQTTKQCAHCAEVRPHIQMASAVEEDGGQLATGSNSSEPSDHPSSSTMSLPQRTGGNPQADGPVPSHDASANADDASSSGGTEANSHEQMIQHPPETLYHDSNEDQNRMSIDEPSPLASGQAGNDDGLPDMVAAARNAHAAGERRRSLHEDDEKPRSSGGPQRDAELEAALAAPGHAGTTAAVQDDQMDVQANTGDGKMAAAGGSEGNSSAANSLNSENGVSGIN